MSETPHNTPQKNYFRVFPRTQFEFCVCMEGASAKKVVDADVVVIGAGLSGLHVASLLQSRGCKTLVLEARERIGGRVLSVDGGFDLGPTWFWPQNDRMIDLVVKKFKLPRLVQKETNTRECGLFEASLASGVHRYNNHEEDGDDNLNVRWRVVGGMARVIESLGAQLAPGTIRLSSPVKKIQKLDDLVVQVDVEGCDRPYLASYVVLAVPPRIIDAIVEFNPPLDSSMFRSTPTWMAGQAKFLAVYESPFWRKVQLSGEAQSRVGPLVHVMDASPQDEGKGALFGFFGIDAEARKIASDLRGECLKQLVRMFGQDAANPISMHFQDWSTEPLTATPRDFKFEQIGNVLRHPWNFWDGKVILAGSECASEYAGYLEGALSAAQRAVDFIFKM